MTSEVRPVVVDGVSQDQAYRTSGARSNAHATRERLGWQYRAATMNWDLRHRKSSLAIRLVLAVWITAVVIVLCATGRWWGLAFVAPLILDLYLLRRILAAGSGR